MAYAITVIIGGIIAIVLLVRHWRTVDEAERERRDRKELRAHYGEELTDEQIQNIFKDWRD